MKTRKKSLTILLASFVAILMIFIYSANKINKRLIDFYDSRKSIVITDSQDKIIKVYQNNNNYYNLRKKDFPNDLKNLIIKKEDKYFFYHLGVNPISSIRALYYAITKSKSPTSSTVSQQLVKILLKNENNRSLKNKIKEIFYSLSLELFTDKNEILNMYLNSLFLGNSTEGLNTASLLYFNKEIEQTTLEEKTQLLATISNPTNSNPFNDANLQESKKIAKILNLKIDEKKLLVRGKKTNKENFLKKISSPSSFEIESLGINLSNNQKLTIDIEMSEKIRSLVNDDILRMFKDGAHNASVVVISTNSKRANEIISITGSPNPEIENYGYKINMATKPRAIGSTVKPFIYTLGFEKGLRPYTLVDDREYKYTIGTGFAFYPKNYDYEYRGIVNLHYALSNSLNVPTVKVLEFIGLENFYSLLENSLEFKPVQDLNNYQLGIALGELEMTLLDLTNYFTIFSAKGILKPLKISEEICLKQVGGQCDKSRSIFEEENIALTNKILTDRKTGIEEFGIKSNLNLPFDNYAVKTGTSREFHDSWTMGYTKDYVVGVWVGNAQDVPMNKVSGQTGAGKIWQDVMNLLYNSKYYKNNIFEYPDITEYNNEGNLEIGLKNDDYETQKNLLLEDKLILSPHDYDEYLYEKDSTIFLKSKDDVIWHINDQYIGEGNQMNYKISSPGKHIIRATNPIDNKSEEISIIVNSD